MFWFAGFIIGIFITSAIIAVVNKTAFSKILHFGRTQAGNIGRAAEKIDAVNQMRESINDAKEQIRVAREALIKSKALKDSLERQIESTKRNINNLESKLVNFKKSDKDRNDPEVISVAEKLAKLKSDLVVNQEQLDIQTQIYNDTLKSSKAAYDKIARMEQRANHLEIKLGTSEAQAELSNLLNSFDPNSINNAFNNIEKFENVINSQIDENAAKLKVNADLGIVNSDDDNITHEVSEILDSYDNIKS